MEWCSELPEKQNADSSLIAFVSVGLLEITFLLSFLHATPN